MCAAIFSAARSNSCCNSSAFVRHESAKLCNSCSTFLRLASSCWARTSASCRLSARFFSAAARCSRSVSMSASRFFTLAAKSSHWELNCASPCWTLSRSCSICALASLQVCCRFAISSSSVALCCLCCSSSRPLFSLSARCSLTLASKVACFSLCSPTSCCKSALFRIKSSQRWRAVESSASTAASRSAPCFSSSLTEFLASSKASLWLSRSRKIFSSKSLMRRDDSSCACCSDSLTASLCVDSSFSWASKEPLACMSESLSNCACAKVSLSCSM
mmetsp:Transcript_81811/g.227844  ORF Transcript_81811/g.227844 Transcript_81811/m.227844 type:complete len:275 (-) Transcript_81811:1851-2675(-)